MNALIASLRVVGACLVLLGCAAVSPAQGPPVLIPPPPALPGPLVPPASPTQPVPGGFGFPPRVPPAPWVEPHPEIPYLPKPAARPANWLVEHAPINPNATPEAKALLHYLYSISGKHTMTGQHNFPAQQEYSTDRASTQTGKTPAIYGTDWGFSQAGDKDSAYVRHDTVKELIKQWQRGSVIALCWHAVRPTEDEPVTFRTSVQGHITDAQFNDVLTPGTDLYKHWCVQVDAIAEYLKQLQDAHVPVLWRPYHEINGDWFWWNGHRGDASHGTKQLYRQLYDRLVNFHHLNNLIWVWNCDQPSRADRQFVDYFPGSQYVDVLALDCYGAYQQSFYDDMNALSDGKVMAISETYGPPTLDIYRTQPKWTYYMRWAVDMPPPPGSRPFAFPPGAFPGGPPPGGGLPGGVPPPVSPPPGSAPPPGAPPPGAFGFRRRPEPDLRPMVSDPHMFSLQDPAYWAAINPVRAAAGLPPLTSPPPLPPPPAKPAPGTP